jgi:enamine deaminase RidA (YjgF/YER057c/UK114 family)
VASLDGAYVQNTHHHAFTHYSTTTPPLSVMAQSQDGRRSFFKRAGAYLASLAGLGAAHAGAADAAPRSKSKESKGTVVTHDDVPLFSSVVVHNGLVYLAGKGAHFEGDIKAHTDHVLSELEKELEEAGSSMEQVIKVTVYLHDLDDYDAMNEVFRGRFGDSPPVRSTVACYGGVPGDSLVEMDCIAALDD